MNATRILLSSTISSSSTSSSSRVYAGYRRLFRARKGLFDGDIVAMIESRKAIKAEFIKNRTAPATGEHFEGLLTMIDEAVDMLSTGIVRGNLNPNTGHYEVKIKKEHVEHSNVDPRMVEPITAATVEKLENPNKINVTTTKSSSCQSKQQQ